jgi:hypothetical protein
MKEHQHHLFLEALGLALLIFLVGIFLGSSMESLRTNKITDMYIRSETTLLDLQIQATLLKTKNIDCAVAVEKNIQFGDSIYEEAKILENYEESNKLTNGLLEQHRKYSVLRTLFWMNSIDIKKSCKNDFHTVVYLYDYNPKDLAVASEQRFFSNFLTRLKEEKGNDIMLIPIAKNMEINSLDIFIAKYNVTSPTIIVDEDLVITRPEDFSKIEDAVGASRQL